MQMLNFLFGSEERAATLPDDDDFWYKDVYRSENFSGDEKTALSIAAVFACVRVLAETFASLPAHVYKRRPDGGKERSDTYFLYELLKFRPNRFNTAFEYWENVIGTVALRGNSFSQKLFNKKNQLIELLPLNANRMKIDRGSDGKPVYVYTTLKGQTEAFGQDEIFHVRGLSTDGYLGLSPLEVARRTFETSFAQDQYNNSFLKNGAAPGGILTYPGKLPDNAVKNLKESWNQLHQGASRANRVAVLEQGIDYKQTGINQRDAQFLELKKLSSTEIARIFRVPPHMIGDLDRATFSNIEQQSIEFVTYTLRPWLVRVEQAIWRDLVPEKDKDTFFIEFLVDGLLRGDIKARYQAYVQGLNNGFLNADEVRAFENLNPVPDGSGQIFRVPLNTAPSNEAGSDPDADDSDVTPAADPTQDDQKQRMERSFQAMFDEIYGRYVRKELKNLQKNSDFSSYENKKFYEKHHREVREGMSEFIKNYVKTQYDNGVQVILDQIIDSFSVKNTNLSKQLKSLDESFIDTKKQQMWKTLGADIKSIIGDNGNG